MTNAAMTGPSPGRDIGPGEAVIGERRIASQTATAPILLGNRYCPPPGRELDAGTGLPPKLLSPDDLALERSFLLPGQLIITTMAQQITTLLGSCVAVTMFDPQFRAAAMCHAMLPQPPRSSQQTALQGPHRFKYLSEAIPAMIAHFRDFGSVPALMVVKIFGGANVLSANSSEARGDRFDCDESVGDANLRFARHLLEAAAFSLTSFNVGGVKGRKIILNTKTGDVLHRFLN